MIIFVGSVHILHQLYPETVVPCSTTRKNHPKYDLPVMPPPTIIWPIPHSKLFWLWNQSYWIPWNMCGRKCITYRLPVLVNPWRYIMVYFTCSGELQPQKCIYKQKKVRTIDYYSWFFTKLYNDMYATWRCKKMCITLCSTTVTNQILPTPYNVLGSFKKKSTRYCKYPTLFYTGKNNQGFNHIEKYNP